MKMALVMLLAAAIVGAGAAPARADASEKKKSVAAKKKVPGVAAQAKPGMVRAKSPQRPASLDDAHHLALQSSAVLVQDQTTGTILFEKNAGRAADRIDHQADDGDGGAGCRSPI
jgi:D-alanyl-D-alanine carboxypeptidase